MRQTRLKYATRTIIAVLTGVTVLMSVLRALIISS
ncbi:MAG: hypothetical protein BWZ01_00859 [Deltaproteobacteria bacterium ADurb.BinA179]|nr:MAG: hypothetical protein BWZ01_00859 [Deltaproteobacteria bacterium ADurb.BinA179]